MKRSWLCLALSSFLASYSALAASGARADDLADEADLLFQRGAERYTASDYPGALEHFLASNRLVPNRNVVFNIALTYEKLKRYPEAYRYYDLALVGETDAAAKARIESALAAIRPHVAVLDIRTVPPGATIYVDRKDLGARGESPRALGLAAGEYKVIAELAGYHPAEKSLPVAAAGTTTLVLLELAPILGTLRVEGPSTSAQVRVDDEPQPRCTVPCTLQLPPGEHALSLVLGGHKPAVASAIVTASQTTTVRPELEVLTGSAVVTTDEPGALVEIDGKARGFTPAIVGLPVGQHTVRLSAHGFRPTTRAVVIEADRQARVEVELAQSEEVEAASRRPERVEDAPSSVTIIPREELVAFGYPTIVEALRGVRGLYTWNDRSYASLGVRGLGTLGNYTNRELVMLDGQPTNDDWIGSAYVGYDARTDLADVDRIEVVRGPGSVLYGTNAFSGVTNLVSRYRDEKPGSELGLSTAGSGVGRVRLRTQQRLGEDGGFWISGSGAHGAGRDFYFPEFDPGDSRGADAFNAGGAQGRVWWRSLTLQAFFHTHDKHLPTGEYETLLGDTRTQQSDTRSFAEARFEPNVSEHVQFLTRVHWNLYRFRGAYARDPADGGIEHDRYDSQWVGAEQRVVIAPVNELRLTVGGEGQLHYHVDQRAGDDSGYYLNDSGSRQRTFQVGAIYALADLEPSALLRMQAGVRLDAYSTFGSSVNPRGAVIVRPYEGGNTKLLFGSAFRAPSVYELYYNDGGLTQLASPNLKPERMFSIELEHSHRFASTVSGVAAVYVNYIENLIVQRGGTASELLHYVNSSTPIGSVGAELGVRRDFRKGTMLEFMGGVQQSRYLASTKLSDLFTQDGNTRRVANSPVPLWSVKAAAPLFAHGLTLASKLTFEGPRADRYESTRDEPQRMTPVAFLWDVVLSGREERFGLGYSLGIYNLADYRYALPVSAEFRQRTIAQNGRTLLASLDFGF